MKYILATVFVISIAPANASELTFQFNSPAFSGQGYSTHVLTIHQLEQQRKDKLVADEQAVIDRAERDIRNTNAYKFQNNLESRIYAQLSRQIADSIFSDTQFWAAEVLYKNGDIVVYNGRRWKLILDSNGATPGIPGETNSKWVIHDSDWFRTETPFGDLVSWKRDDSRIFIQIEDSNGDMVVEFDVPIGEFAF
jgi:hypothetical protein